ncbi:transglutaminase-like domain-containing protein [Streptomyces sp. SID8352]|uniref:transglutaminase-like domain-containing protein n=1 Tax=Streptomyces sp. SID8352 TaxID=2690338 RepID=UPI001371E24C|nr:transglutaminase-like domain-containing protein [Streptomyces sp. SID8352]MYU23205.1 hypothetical protein [Streptomyces sp. SID8352]
MSSVSLPPESLRATLFCDADHPAVRATAISVSCDSETVEEKISRLFSWVQDGIRMTIKRDWADKASETMESRRGGCSNKANLLVAMLRSVGIPAAFYRQPANAKEYFGPVWFSQIQAMCDEDSCHFYAAVWVSDRWVKCDPTDDLQLSLGSSHFNPPSERITFDGTKDSLLNLNPMHLEGAPELVWDLDQDLGSISKKPDFYFAVMDAYWCFLRLEGPRFESVDALPELFRIWLGARDPELAVMYERWCKELEEVS